MSALSDINLQISNSYSKLMKLIQDIAFLSEHTLSLRGFKINFLEPFSENQSINSPHQSRLGTLLRNVLTKMLIL